MDLGTLSRLKIISQRKKELVALFKLSCDCLFSVIPPHGVIGCSEVGGCCITPVILTVIMSLIICVI